MSPIPDYYKLLNITKSASQDQVRQAYRKESLKLVHTVVLHKFHVLLLRVSTRTHPDRLVNTTPAEVKEATERFQVNSQFFYWRELLCTYNAFQAVADAYYVLSDPKRRQEYDILCKTRSDRTDDPSSSSGFFSQFSSMFGGAAPNRTGTAQPNPDGVFADVFDEVSILATSLSLVLSKLIFIVTSPRD